MFVRTVGCIIRLVVQWFCCSAMVFGDHQMQRVVVSFFVNYVFVLEMLVRTVGCIIRPGVWFVCT